MKTKAEIEFNFEQARRRAAELEEIAQDLASLAKRDMENTRAELAAAWKGESAQLFCGKSDKLQQDIASTAKELAAVAGSIREIARLVYEAEMQALQIAAQRDYV